MQNYKSRNEEAISAGACDVREAAQGRAVGRIYSIQYLRGIAALAVACYHIKHILVRLGFVGEWPSVLFWSGVDIFFVISGFVIWHSTASRQMTLAAFWRHRIRRLVPLYWVFTGVLLLVAVLLPHAVNNVTVVWPHVVASFFFIPWTNPATGDPQPLLISGWSLNAEMAFYVLFGFALLLPRQLRIAAVSIGLLVPVVLRFVTPQPSVALGFYGDDLMLEFAYGLVLGWAWNSGWRPKFIFSAVAVPVGIVLLGLLGDHSPHMLFAGLPATLIVLGMLGVEAAGRLPRLPALAVLGDASYSLYLVHPLLLSAVGLSLAHLGANARSGWAVAWLTTFLISLVIVAALMTHWLVERPLDRWVGRRLAGRLSKAAE